MPPDPEPYRLRVWARVADALDLHQDDVVRLKGSETRWSVRVTVTDTGRKLRLRAIDENGDVERNVFFHDSILFLAEEGLLEKRLLADVREYDVWADEEMAFAFYGDDNWLDLIKSSKQTRIFFARTHELPDDLALVWRRSITEVSF